MTDIQPWVDDHFEAIQRYCYFLCKDSTSGDDLVQKTWLNVLQYCHTYNPDKPLLRWLRTIAFNTFHRRRQIETTSQKCDNAYLQSLELLYPLWAWPPDQIYDYFELSSPMALTMQEVEDRYGPAFARCAILGETRKEVAKALGIPFNTVLSAVHRSKTLARTRLQELHEEREALK